MKSPESPHPKPPRVSDPLFGDEKPTEPTNNKGTADTATGGRIVTSGELKIGGALAGYRLVKKLGEGGMGMVFAAEDIRLKRRVALKLMKPEVAAKEQHRQRFLREAQAAAAVEHDHIVPIFQIGEDNGVPYFAMPFLKGEPLDARIKRERLSIPEIITIARQTADGLAAAHEHGLIHRDIKPGNIWLETTADGGQRVKILDFGLARFSSENQQQLTQSGAVMGTPAYMAPEQARGRPVDHRADLFSLGCILYELTVGKRPFTGPDTMAILTSLALDTPSEPRSLNAAVPAALSQLVMRLLEKDSTRRPASAREVGDALRRMQPENTVVVVAPSVPPVEDNPWADIDARSFTEVPLAEPEPSMLSLGPDSAVDSTPSGTRSSPDSRARSEPRSGYSSRAMKRLEVHRVSPKAKWFIGGGLLAIAIVVAILVGVIKNLRDKEKGDGGSNNNGGAGSTTPVGAGENFALEFDGKNSAIDLPTLHFQGGSYTLEAFVTPATATGDNGLIVSVIRAGGIALEHSADCWQGIANSNTGNGNIQSAPNSAQAGQRVHVAFVWDGKKGSIYLNGRKSAESLGKAPHAFDIPGMHLGGYLKPDGTVDRPFAGVLDEIRVSRIARYENDFVPLDRFTSDRNTIALYHCDEGSGDTLKDASFNGNHVKIKSGIVKWVKPDAGIRASQPVAQPAKNALAFDGKTSFATVPELQRNDIGPVTMEAWVRKASNGVICCLQGKAPVQIFFHEGLFCAAFWGPDGKLSDDLATAQQVICPMWTHLAFVYDGNESRLYVNGKLSQTRKGKVELLVDSPAFNYSQVGAGAFVNDAPTAAFFDGELRDLRISNSARYTADFAPENRLEGDISTLALYHADEGTGDTLRDASASARHGRLKNHKWIAAE